jgi:hypothetical protein
MLGRKDYTNEEFDNGRTAVDQQVAAYRRLATAIAGATDDTKVEAAREHFETRFFRSMVLVMDRYFVHRLRQVTGKDANPLNEVEMIADSLMNNDDVLRVSNAIKWIPDETVLKLKVGDAIKLTGADFDRLSAAFFSDLERKFL